MAEQEEIVAGRRSKRVWFTRLSLSDVEQMPARRLSDPVMLCIDIGGGKLAGLLHLHKTLQFIHR